MICNGFFRSATTIKDCSHTFCRVCLVRYIINKGSHCPKCYLSISSNYKETLGNDETVQNLLDTIFPYFIDQEKQFLHKYYASQDFKLADEKYTKNLEPQDELPDVSQSVSNEKISQLLMKTSQSINFYHLKITITHNLGTASLNAANNPYYMLIHKNTQVDIIIKYLNKTIDANSEELTLYLLNNKLLANETIDHAIRRISTIDLLLLPEIPVGLVITPIIIEQ